MAAHTATMRRGMAMADLDVGTVALLLSPQSWRAPHLTFCCARTGPDHISTYAKLQLQSAATRTAVTGKYLTRESHHFRLVLCGHKAVEAGAVCLVLMVQGHLADVTLAHLAIAAKT